MLTIEDFKKLDLRIGKVLAAEAVAGSEKLLRLRVDIGSGERQILAGIARHYSPDSLVGRQIVVLANLETRIFNVAKFAEGGSPDLADTARSRGLESQGMMLAANADGPVILTPEREVPAGTEVR